MWYLVPLICLAFPLGMTLLVCVFFLYRGYRRLTNGHPWHWLRARYGWGRTIEELAPRIGMTAEELRALKPSYQEVFIAKKRGGRRRLLIPDKNLKKVQRLILNRLLRKL